MVVIGIDFGSSNSVVAFCHRRTVTIIENDQGKRKTPSCVAFAQRDRLIGNAAIHQISRNPENTILGAKLLIGRTFQEAYQLVQRKKWPYKLINERGKPKIEDVASVKYLAPSGTKFLSRKTTLAMEEIRERVNLYILHYVAYKGHKKFYPEEIIAMILLQLKKDVEVYSGQTVTGAVITVPDSFDDAQRRGIEDAAAIADLRVVGLINETIAAAIAFGTKEQIYSPQNVLILHIGGGTFDASVITVQRNTYHVRGTYGSSGIGGDSYHDEAFEKIIQHLEGTSLSQVVNKPRALCRLRLACQKSKEDLSLSNSTSIRVEALFSGEDFKKRLSDEIFQDWNEQNTVQIQQGVEGALAAANMDSTRIDKIFLVGAATRMPIVKRIITERCRLDPRKIKKTINVDEAPAQGAAIWAETLSSSGHGVGDITILPDCMEKQQNPPGPKKFQLPDSFRKYGVLVAMHVKNTTGDKEIGEFTIRPENSSVQIEISSNGILEVKTNDVQYSLKPQLGINQQEIEQLKRNVKACEEEDVNYKKRVKRLHEIEKEIYKLQPMAQSDSYIRNLTRILESIKENPDVTVEEIENIFNEVENIRHKIEKQKVKSASKSRPGTPSHQSPRGRYQTTVAQVSQRRSTPTTSRKSGRSATPTTTLPSKFATRSVQKGSTTTTSRNSYHSAAPKTTYSLTTASQGRHTPITSRKAPSHLSGISPDAVAERRNKQSSPARRRDQPPITQPISPVQPQIHGKLNKHSTGETYGYRRDGGRSGRPRQ